MTYRDALATLAASSARGMRLGLAPTRALCAALGDPQDELRGVLVAGTNGKGSVAAMVAAIGASAGYRVALLTKPHLTSYRERIVLGGEPVSEDRFGELVQRVLAAAGKLEPSTGGATHHELLTAMGFQAAHDWGAEITVCEVGLGGRLDATNVWDGGVAVLTSVGLDHQAQLGNTIPEIAREKAAIIKPKDLVVSGVADGALLAVATRARLAGARLWQLGEQIQVEPEPNSDRGRPRLSVVTPKRALRELEVGLEGGFQLRNAGLAVAVGDCLSDLGFQIPDAAVRAGLATVRWPGRLQSLGGAPEVVVDAAHNPPAVAAILGDLEARIRRRRTVLLFASMSDHDHRLMLELLARLDFANAVLTRSRSTRAVDPDRLLGEWNRAAEVVEPSQLGLQTARRLAGVDGQVVALGSIYLVGEVMAALGVGLPPDPEVPFQPQW
ncbi:MAG: bifunctional folylpolyglutamate synthase/dihydrofolate synthase [Candidatus Dormibacteria bacterium]